MDSYVLPTRWNCLVVSGVPSHGSKIAHVQCSLKSLLSTISQSFGVLYCLSGSTVAQ